MTRSAMVSKASPAASYTGLPMMALRCGMRALRSRTAVAFRFCTRSPARAERCGGPSSTTATAARIVAYSMPGLSAYTLTALRAAAAAAEIHRASFGQVVRVDYKGRHDVVTDADRAAEAVIVATIRET